MSNIDFNSPEWERISEGFRKYGMVSVSDFSRGQASRVFREIQEGEKDNYTVLKNNKEIAHILSNEEYWKLEKDSEIVSYLYDLAIYLQLSYYSGKSFLVNVLPPAYAVISPITTNNAHSQIQFKSRLPSSPETYFAKLPIESVSINVNKVIKLNTFIALTPSPTETNTLFPNKPKIQNKKQSIQAPPPTAIEFLDLLNNEDAPKQIPINANSEQNEAKQYNTVRSGTIRFGDSGLLALLIASAIASLDNAEIQIITYITIKAKSKNKYCVLTTVFLLVGVDNT